jgi:NDP-sugar pyrophosphorylase family protein
MILAAGLGTRLRPLTDYRAKPALPVRGRPVISLLLELLARHGVDQVLINLHHRPTTIREAVERDHPTGMTIHWSEEPRPLGTGGGIRRAAEFLRESDECLVMAGDMLLDIDIAQLLSRHRASGRDVSLVLREDSRGDDFGTIGIDERGQLTRIGKQELSRASQPLDDPIEREARQGLFTGVRFFSRSALVGWPDEEAFEDLRDWLAPRVEKGLASVGAEIVELAESVWEPVGTPDEYLRVNLTPPSLPSLGGDVAVWTGSVLPLGPTRSSIVARSASVPADADLKRCVVWDGERVPAGFEGQDGVFAGQAFHPCSSPPFPSDPSTDPAAMSTGNTSRGQL